MNKPIGLLKVLQEYWPGLLLLAFVLTCGYLARISSSPAADAIVAHSTR